MKHHTRYLIQFITDNSDEWIFKCWFPTLSQAADHFRLCRNKPDPDTTYRLVKRVDTILDDTSPTVSKISQN